MSTLLRLIRGFKSEGQGVDIPEKAPERPKTAILPKQERQFHHSFIVTVWPRAPMRLGWVECAKCKHKEKIKARISVIQKIQCTACGEVKAQFLPGSTPLDPPSACPCGEIKLVLKQSALWCYSCKERVEIKRHPSFWGQSGR